MRLCLIFGLSAGITLGDPHAGCERFLHLARFWLTSNEDGYGVLDVLDENGDIVQDFMIADAAGFRQIKHRLHLKVNAVEATEGDDA